MITLYFQVRTGQVRVSCPMLELPRFGFLRCVSSCTHPPDVGFIKPPVVHALDEACHIHLGLAFVISRHAPTPCYEKRRPDAFPILLLRVHCQAGSRKDGVVTNVDT